ncbi:hypothetical protein C8A01DRAFT_40442 [Parachaetomium inaequale]|uniref:Uncharacterized protein n=1 Tax=Parachaetomium inaequale TaxID=2588326 RepID=A0AAN6SMI5_9PEZI|nr:hypothetical protein C8A01DRAFT_40442 [Parachaetomium inaequale]
MCTAGYNHFSCGCSLPNPATLKQCEYAKLRGGETCPQFMITEDKSHSKTYDLLACMAHS